MLEAQKAEEVSEGGVAPIVPAPAPETPPAVEEAAAADDELAAQKADEVSEGGVAPIVPPPLPEPSPVATPAAAADDELAEQKADEISEGGPVQTPADPDTPAPDKPAETAVPDVRPEPKG